MTITEFYNSAKEEVLQFESEDGFNFNVSVIATKHNKDKEMKIYYSCYVYIYKMLNIVNSGQYQNPIDAINAFRALLQLEYRELNKPMDIELK